MRDGTCPKCQSTDLRVARNNRGPYGMNTIPTSHGVGVVGLDNYVCTGCGYVEFYISNEKGLKKITDKWETV